MKWFEINSVAWRAKGAEHLRTYFANAFFHQIPCVEGGVWGR